MSNNPFSSGKISGSNAPASGYSPVDSSAQNSTPADKTGNIDGTEIEQVKEEHVVPPPRSIWGLLGLGSTAKRKITRVSSHSTSDSEDENATEIFNDVSSVDSDNGSGSNLSSISAENSVVPHSNNHRGNTSNAPFPAGIKDGEVLPDDLEVPAALVIRTRGAIENSGESSAVVPRNQANSTQHASQTSSAQTGAAVQHSSHDLSTQHKLEINLLDALLLKNETEIETRILTIEDNKKWSETAHAVKTYCNHLLHSGTPLDFSKIKQFEEQFSNVMIALLERYHAKKAGLAAYDMKMETLYELAKKSPNNLQPSKADEKRFEKDRQNLNEFLEEGLGSLQEAFSSFKEVVKSEASQQFSCNSITQAACKAQQAAIDQKYDFESLSRSVQIIISEDVFQKNIEDLTNRSQESNTSVQDANKFSENKKKFLAEKEKWTVENDNYRTWTTYLFGTSKDQSTFVVFKKIKDLAVAINAEKQFRSLENKSTADSFAALNKLKKNPEAYQEAIAYLKANYPPKPEAQTLDKIVADLSSQARDKGTIIHLGENGLEARKSAGILESFRNLFRLNGFSFFSNYHEYDLNRKAIKDVREKVYAQYGSTALKRFDYHFSYRYRLGAPLTTTALTKFLSHEKYLNSQGAVITIKAEDLKPPEGITLDQKLLMKITEFAAAEFEARYGKIEKEDDRVILYDHFLEQFVKRPLDIVKADYNSTIKEAGFGAFIGSRFNAMYTSLFAGDNKNQNQWTIKLIKDLLLSSVKSKEVEGIIKRKLKAKKMAQGSQTLTFQDVCLLTAEFNTLKIEHDTFYNHRIKPWVRWLANIAGTAAGVETLATASNPIMGAAAAIGIAGANVVMEPEDRLILSLGIYFAEMGKAVNKQETSWLERATNISLNVATGGLWSIVA